MIHNPTNGCYDNQHPDRALYGLPRAPFAIANREYMLTGSSPLAVGNHGDANPSITMGAFSGTKCWQ